MEEIFNDFKVKIIDGEHYIIANSNLRPNMDLKVAKILNVRYPSALAKAIASSLTGNSKLKLVDLI